MKTPRSIEELADLILQARDHGNRIKVSSTTDSGDGVTLVSLSGLNQVIDYPFDDMTITVQAGMRCGELSDLLRGHNQQLPIDVMDPNTTIGKLVAANLFGPRIAGHGMARDHLIGVQAVDGAGRVFRSGGKVVKNVAGYDLCRLLIGSHGRLGIITECTFRLNPLPRTSAGVRLRCADHTELTATLSALNSSESRPVIIDLQYRPSKSDGCEIVVGVEGSAESCEWQINEIRLECRCAATEMLNNDAVLQHLQDVHSYWSQGQMRIRTLRSQVPAVVEFLQFKKIGFRGHAGNGILYCDDQKQLTDALVASLPQLEIQTDHWPPVYSPDEHPLNSRFLSTFDPDQVFTPAPHDESSS